MLSDAFALARSGDGSLAAALKIALACHSRRELDLIRQLRDDLGDLLKVHSVPPTDEESLSALRSLVRGLFRPIK